MRRLLIMGIKKCLRIAMRSRQSVCSRIVDESNLPTPGIDNHQQFQLNDNNHDSACLIPCMWGLFTCFSGRHHDLSNTHHPHDATGEAPFDCDNLRSIWFAASDPATSTADRNYLMVHDSLRYAIFI